MKDYLFNKIEFLKPLNKQKRAAQTVYCFTKESELIKTLYNVFKHSKEFNTELSFILFFDGAYVSYENIVAYSKINEYINETNELILPFKFISKPIDIESNWSYLNEDILEQYKNIIELSLTYLMKGNNLKNIN